jgi:crossover junction endodeoxyribonuclease RusA
MDIDAVSYVFESVPPSVNACFRAGGKRVYKSKRYREYIEQMEAYFDKQEHVPILEGELKLEVTLSFKSKRKRDIDNCMKALLDCLEGRLFDDDSQIFELNIRKQIGCQAEQTAITLSCI